MRRDSATAIALAALVFVASLAAFWPAADAGFVNWDDESVVTGNYRFRGLDAESLAWMGSTSLVGHYQPLSWLSLALDHARHGLTPPDFPEAGAFHRTNLLLHAAGAVALYLLALALLPRALPAAPRGAPLALAAAFAALLHAVHPLRCESVCWVTERRDVLSGLFFVLAVWAYVRGAPQQAPAPAPRTLQAAAAATAAAALLLFFGSVSTADPASLHWSGPGATGLGLAVLCWLTCAAACAGAAGDRRRGGWLLACFALAALSLGAKAWGIVLPALLLILDTWPLGRWRRAGGRDTRALQDALVEKLPLVVLSLAFARLARWAQMAQQGSVDVWSLHTPQERLVQALYGLAFYPARTLLPFDLVPLHPIPDELHLLEPRFLVAALFSVGLSVALVAAARRFPAGLATWAAFAVIVSPVLGVQQTGPQLVADRYTYLAGIPFALLAGGFAWRWLGGRARQRRLALAAGVLLLVGLGGLTWRQSRVWRSSEALWTHALRRGPRVPLALLNLGLVRADQARAADSADRRRALEEEALALYAEGAEREPSNELFAINTAILLAERAQGQSGAEREGSLARAEALTEKALATSEAKGLHESRLYWHRGRILFLAGRLDAAIASFRESVALRPRWPDAHLSLGGALLERARRVGSSQPAEALPILDEALAQVASAAPDAAGDPRLASLTATGQDLRWQILLHLDRPAEAEAARQQALRAYAAIPADDPRQSRARERIRVLVGTEGPQGEAGAEGPDPATPSRNRSRAP